MNTSKLTLNIASPLAAFASALLIQGASEASEADSQSCSIEISDIYIYICRYVCVRQKNSPALLIT